MSQEPTQGPESLILPHTVMPTTSTGLRVYMATAAISATRIPEAMGADVTVRGHLPAAIDAPNHIANTGVTLLLLSHFAHSFWGKEAQLQTPEAYDRKRKRFAGAIGVMTVAMNAFAEKVGYGPVSTPDYLDFAYGLVGGYLVYKFNQPQRLTPGNIAYLDQNEFDANDPRDKNLIRLKNLLGKARAKRQAPESASTEAQPETNVINNMVESPTVAATTSIPRQSTRADKGANHRRAKRQAQRKSRKANRK